MIPRSHTQSAAGQGSHRESSTSSHSRPSMGQLPAGWTTSAPMHQPQHQHSSDPHDGNSIFHEENEYNYAPQQPLWQAVSQPSSQLQQTPLRSNPIAIRSPHEAGHRPSVYTDDEDDEDENGIVDVERDAYQLRQKYGSKVIEVSATYKAPSVLKAPYLGSLRSEHYLMSLPPMSLAAHDVVDEPPLNTTSYGSLRESHQKGRFLDGPSSYREPRSGKIRQLHHGLRYRGDDYVAGSMPQGLSIGERMQQYRKLKETRMKEKERTEQGSEEKMSLETSSLSVMMNQVSQQKGEEKDGSLSSMFLSKEASVQVPTFADNDHQSWEDDDPPSMLSTSLTAFEVLTSSNSKHSVASADSNGNARSFARCQSSFFPRSEAEVREQNFKPLSRSMSDPTPRFLGRSRMDVVPLVLLPPPSENGQSATTIVDPKTTTITTAAAGRNQFAGSAPAVATTETRNNTPSVAGSLDQLHPQIQAMGYPVSAATNGCGYPPAGQHHNPDTDAAFDMDME